MSFKSKKPAKNTQKSKEFILTIDLVPRTVWFSSLYRLMPKEKWKTLKRKIYEKEGRKCYICGSTRPPFELHEFWEYDDENHIQRLVGTHHLCLSLIHI